MTKIELARKIAERCLHRLFSDENESDGNWFVECLMKLSKDALWVLWEEL